MLRFVFLLLLFAAATYLVVRVIQARGLMPDRPSRPGRAVPGKMVAPDDDEDFLRDLDRKDRKRRDPEDPPPSDA